jgi:hypothetical protein
MPARSDIAFRSAKPRQKSFKLSDGGGLYLLVQPNAAKLWRLAYRFDGKQKLLALGPYPVTSLSDARAKRDAAKKLLAQGSDPSVERKAERGDSGFKPGYILGGDDTLHGADGGGSTLIGDNRDAEVNVTATSAGSAAIAFNGSMIYGGIDSLVGGSGGDLLIGDDQTANVFTGADTTAEGTGQGDATARAGQIRGGNDPLLSGGAGDDTLYGDSLSAHIDTEARSDTGNAEATPKLGLENSIIGGNDDLVGGSGVNNLIGDSGRAEIFTFAESNSSGNATAVAGNILGGDDSLDGTLGEGTLIGDSGFNFDTALTSATAIAFIGDAAATSGNDRAHLGPDSVDELFCVGSALVSRADFAGFVDRHHVGVGRKAAWLRRVRDRRDRSFSTQSGAV